MVWLSNKADAHPRIFSVFSLLAWLKKFNWSNVKSASGAQRNKFENVIDCIPSAYVNDYSTNTILRKSSFLQGIVTVTSFSIRNTNLFNGICSSKLFIRIKFFSATVRKFLGHISILSMPNYRKNLEIRLKIKNKINGWYFLYVYGIHISNIWVYIG